LQADPVRCENLRDLYEEGRQRIQQFLQPQVHQVFLQQPILYGFHQINRLGALTSRSRLRQALRTQVFLFDLLALTCASLVQNFEIAEDKVSAYLSPLDIRGFPNTRGKE